MSNEFFHTESLEGAAEAAAKYGSTQSGNDLTLAQKQTGLAFDLLSEGPIEGLVNEAEGIFLNGVPLRDKDTNAALK